jgi:hypothetical protein
MERRVEKGQRGNHSKKQRGEREVSRKESREVRVKKVRVDCHLTCLHVFILCRLPSHLPLFSDNLNHTNLTKLCIVHACSSLFSCRSSPPDSGMGGNSRVKGGSPPPSPLPPHEHKGRGKEKDRDGPEHVQHGHPTKPLTELVEELAVANRNLVTLQPTLCNTVNVTGNTTTVTLENYNRHSVTP